MKTPQHPKDQIKKQIGRDTIVVEGVQVWGVGGLVSHCIRQINTHGYHATSYSVGGKDVKFEVRKMTSREQAIRELDEIRDSDKIEAFNKLYAFALDRVKRKEAEERDKDYRTYAFEELMERTIVRDQDSFWDYWRNLPDGCD